MFRNIRVDWCKTINGTGDTNFLVKALVRMVKERNLLKSRTCPFKGKSGVKNIAMSQDFFTIIPKGIFRAVVHLQYSGNNTKSFVHGSLIITGA